ncbi:unnamed protein product, partial [Tuber aestivum]
FLVPLQCAAIHHLRFFVPPLHLSTRDRLLTAVKVLGWSNPEVFSTSLSASRNTTSASLALPWYQYNSPKRIIREWLSPFQSRFLSTFRSARHWRT